MERSCGDGSGVTSEDFADSSCPSGMVTISSGETSATFAVSTSDDDVVEGLEEFDLTLTDVVPNIDGRITISDSMSTASVTITDEAVLSVSVPDFVEESVIGVSVGIFTVSLADGVTAISDITLSWRVNCATDVTGVASSVDFAGGCPFGIETITEGETSAVFSFMTLDDEVREVTESFTVSIVTMTAGDFNIVFDDRAGDFVSEVNLLDNDGLIVRVVSNDSSVAEGGSVTFNLLLDDTISREVALPWRVSFGSASVSDFAPGQALSGIVTIPASTVTSASVTLFVVSDNVLEGDEVFRVIVPVADRPSSAFVIQDREFSSEDVTVDDADRGVISVNAVSAIVDEGNAVVFNVELTNVVTVEPIVVEWSVTCGGDSDVTIGDFVGGCPSGTVTISSGETSAMFAVSTSDDDVVEGLEVLTVAIDIDSVSPAIRGLITISDTMDRTAVGIRDNDDDMVVISFDMGFRTISAGSGHTCGIRENGEVACWGNIPSIRDTPPPSVRFRTIDVGFDHTCGIREEDDKVECWGTNSTGQSTLPPELVDVRFRAVNAGVFHTCGIIEGGIDDGEVACWGSNTVEQSDPPPDVRFRAVAAGGSHNCGIRENDGKVECWGSNFQNASTLPTSLKDARFRAVSALNNHTCGIIDGGIRDGEVGCWGNNRNGQSTLPPELVGVRFRAVDSGRSHTCGIIDGGIDDGEVTCWGDDRRGQSTLPPELADVRFRAVTSGEFHTCGIQEGGEAVCWGDDLSPQSSPPPFAIPEGGEGRFRVSFLSDVTADEDIAVEWSVSCMDDVSVEDFIDGCPSGTVTIAAGSGFERFTIPTKDNSIVENDEEFTVSLKESSPSIEGRITISSTRSSVTATIADDDTVDISFAELAYDVLEDVNSVTLSVSMFSGEIQEGVIVMVDVMAIDGSGVADKDYTVVMETLMFSSEVRTQTVSVSILDDAVVEVDEDFELGLSSKRILPAATARVLIRDDDRGVVSVMAVTDTVSEGAEVGFIVNLSGDVTADESIDVSWSVGCEDGSGVTAADFADSSCPSGMVTISSGETSATFAVSTSDDDVVEGLEEFDLTLTDVVPNIDGRITISATMSTASVTILANDGVPPVAPEWR